MCGCVLCGCVCACSISAQTFETGVFMFELKSGTVCVWLCAVWVCVCMFISAQTFETGVFMFELSWSKACGCVAPVPIPHTVYLQHYILTSKHTFQKGSCIVPILFLSFSLLLLSIIIISSLLTPPHPQPLVQLSSSNECEVTPTSVLQGLSIISVLQIESSLLSISIRHDNTIYKTITFLCVYCSVYLLYSITAILIHPDSYGTFLTCQVHFIPIKGVRHTLYADTGHKYCTPYASNAEPLFSHFCPYASVCYG